MARKATHRYKSDDFTFPSGVKPKDLDWVAFAWAELREEKTSHRNKVIVRHRKGMTLLGPGANISQVQHLDSDHVSTYRNRVPFNRCKSVTGAVARTFLTIPDIDTLTHDPVLVDFEKNGMKERLLDLHPKWFGDREVVTLGDAIAYGDDDVERILVDHMHEVLNTTPSGSGLQRPLEDYLADLVAGFTPSASTALYGPVGDTTLGELRKSGEVLISEQGSPAGTFTATSWSGAALVVYLLSGTVNDPGATILGRVEMPSQGGGLMRAFKGGGTGGGDRLTRVDDAPDAFAQMVS